MVQEKLKNWLKASPWEWFEELLQRPKVKILLVSLLIGTAVTGYASEYAKQVGQDIADSVIRLHVLANSDSDQDQALKLKVRDAVIVYLQDKLDTAEDIAETRYILGKEMPDIKQVAQATIQKEGYTYPVNICLGTFDFPTKIYGNARLPAGKYEALRITIGEAKGQNWWCVLYPQLCFTDTPNGELTDDSKQKLKNVLTEEEYEIVTDNGEQPRVEFKFKILELFH